MSRMFRGKAIFKPLNTGWTDDLDFAFLHRDELCKPFTKKYADPSAPYDGYVEDDDTEEGARYIPLVKVETGGSLAGPDDMTVREWYETTGLGDVIQEYRDGEWITV